MAKKKNNKLQKTQEEIDAGIGFLMDANSHLMKLTRDESLSWGDIARGYHSMGDMAEHISDLQAVLSAAAAKQAQALIKTEFGIDVDNIDPKDFDLSLDDEDDTTDED